MQLLPLYIKFQLLKLVGRPTFNYAQESNLFKMFREMKLPRKESLQKQFRETGDKGNTDYSGPLPGTCKILVSIFHVSIHMVGV